MNHPPIILTIEHYKYLLPWDADPKAIADWLSRAQKLDDEHTCDYAKTYRVIRDEPIRVETTVGQSLYPILTKEQFATQKQKDEAKPEPEPEPLPAAAEPAPKAEEF